MAQRPVYFPSSAKSECFVSTNYIDFKWFPGMAKSQYQKSIASLHENAKRLMHFEQILEISTRSDSPLGVRLSAFNLTFSVSTLHGIKTDNINRKVTMSVESAFQGSKVFSDGGPYVDLYQAKSIDAKRDSRLRNPSSKLKGFSFFDMDWPLEPKTLFYDWLYLNALHQNPELSTQITSYEAFTDIAFNPEKSLNCQAYSAALYVSLSERNLLDEVLKNSGSYIQLMTLKKRVMSISRNPVQKKLF